MVNILAGCLAGLTLALNLQTKHNMFLVGGFLGGVSTVSAVSMQVGHFQNLYTVATFLEEYLNTNFFITPAGILTIGFLILLLNYYGCFLACRLGYRFGTHKHIEQRCSVLLDKIKHPAIGGISLFGITIIALFLVYCLVRFFTTHLPSGDTILDYDFFTFTSLTFVLTIFAGGVGVVLRLFILQQVKFNKTVALFGINMAASVLIMFFVFPLHFGMFEESHLSNVIQSALMAGFCGGFSSLSALVIDGVKNKGAPRKLIATAFFCTLASVLVSLAVF
jgi:fluoride ion exporter CrcB/FEX